MPPLDADARLPVAPPPLKLRPITVADYHAMSRAGVFRDDERVELLDGCLLPMSPLGDHHLIVTNRIASHFSDHRRGRYLVSTQNSVRLDDRSEPQPDVALLLPAYDEEVRHPEPRDVLLLVEVADATLAKDRDVKRPRYAAAGIAEVWIVSTQEGCVEVAREPTVSGYGRVDVWTTESRLPLVPKMLPDLPPLDLAALFLGLI